VRNFQAAEKNVATHLGVPKPLQSIICVRNRLQYEDTAMIVKYRTYGMNKLHGMYSKSLSAMGNKNKHL